MQTPLGFPPDHRLHGCGYGPNHLTQVVYWQVVSGQFGWYGWLFMADEDTGSAGKCKGTNLCSDRFVLHRLGGSRQK